MEVLRKRIDRFGVAEPIIQSAGGNRILIQLPGLSQSDKESAREQIQRTAYLEFRMVRDDSDEIIQIVSRFRRDTYCSSTSNLNQAAPAESGQVIVNKKPENGLAGDIVKSSMVVRGNLGEPQIDFTLTDDGATKFAETTRDNVGHSMAIVLDGELYSAPNINQPIESGNGQITGTFTIEEAQELANVLQNPLRAPLKIIYASDVDADAR